MNRLMILALTVLSSHAALAGTPPAQTVPAVPEPLGAAVFAAGAVLVTLALRKRRR